MIIVIWLRLALWRHASNLDLTFSRASQADRLLVCYELVAMRQVFTLPVLDVSGGKVRWVEQPSAITGTILYSLPFFVQLAVVVWDVSSLEAGAFSSVNHAIVSLAISFTLLLSIAWLIFHCARLQVIITSIWRKWHDTMEKVRSQGAITPG